MKRLSIQKKIILWFAGALIIIVALMTILSLSIAANVLNENIKERLVRTVYTNAEEIEFINEDHTAEREEGDFFISYGDGQLEIDDDFCDFYEGICTGLFTSDGSLLYGESPVRIDEKDKMKFINVDMVKYKGEKYYVYDKALTGESLDGLWLRGVVAHNEGINVLYNVLRLSLWLLPLLAALALFGGYIITRRSFLPVEQIATEAAHIGDSGDLSKRINIGEGDDELHQLADTFNEMFGKLEKSFEAEKQFTSDASHELRTPTAVIMAQSEYALELAENEEEYRESLEVIHRQSKKMNEIINQLLFFARLGRNSKEISLEKRDISGLTAEICREQEMLWEAKGKTISLSTDIDEGVFANTEESLFARLVTNLISNAYKYGKDNGNVKVMLKRNGGGEAALSVADDGIGISPENLDKIWNRFYQEDQARTGNADFSGGVGLGLSMVKEIADILKGRITVDSTLGEGSRFTFTFNIIE